MGEIKRCALIRQTWYETATAHMADLERLAFYETCFRYEFTGEIPTANTCKYASVLMLFDMVRNDLANDREKAEKIAERARVNGARGGRPRRNPVSEDNETQQNEKTQPVIAETESVIAGNSGFPIHNNIQHTSTLAASSIGGSGVLDVKFFDLQIWPRLNRDGKWNTRHRKCTAAWEGYSERKRQAIVKAVLSDAFAGATNPFFYLEDFAEPEPYYLSGRQCEQEWKAGRDVIAVNVSGVTKYVTPEDAKAFGLAGKVMHPAD